MPRGDGAEWCPKCKAWVMPVFLNSYGRRPDRWHCSKCYTTTQEKVHA